MTDIPMTGSVPATEAPNQVPDTNPQNSFGFYAARGAYFKMLLKFMLLQIITLGIYRFWAKTHVRRYLWSSTEFLGDRFEYLGTAKELFIGFLIAVAFLVPLGVVNHFAELMLGADSTGFAIYSLMYFGVLMFLINFAVFRLWRYRLTRTSWRGIRFGMQQGALKYSIRAIFWMVLTVITIGLAYPWMRANLTRYKINQISFGQASFFNKFSGSKLFKFYILLWISIVSFILLQSSYYITGLFDGFNLGKEGLSVSEKIDRLTVHLYLKQLVLVPLILIPVFYVLYKVKEYTLLLNSTTIGSSSLKSFFRIRDSLSITISFVLALVIWMGVCAAIVYGLIGTLEIGSMGDMESIIAIAGIVIFFLGMGLIYRIIFEFTLLRKIIETTEVSDISNIEKISRSDKDISTHGEGFADAFDVGAF